MAVNWLKIKNDYINGGGSYRKLAEKYGVSTKSIVEHAKAEEWQYLKAQQENRTSTSLQQKTQEKIADALSDEAAAKARIRAKLIRMAEDWIDGQVDAMGDTADYRRIVQSCADMGVFDRDGNEKAGGVTIIDDIPKPSKDD